ncbi:uncharacterized protein [Aegilops tauschii subsp. strangulata]|uniref:Receptor kinase-like protein Xa21 n=2 Tax=Aegilops tauschii TaxID=37682 RepID=A0A453DI51_AEGTS|nr:probable LRR receptor-like serine/threonine-protein kinase At3g47570 [Aegilops tauschii subsp. strangulata]XP_045089403.1 probable LRR receptor-like serine/threonine-protein kinase At3g47570 [Aegilops tauschii subsp. strangulata]
MFPLPLLLLLLHSLWPASSISAFSAAEIFSISNETDMDSLLALKTSLGDQSGVLSSWNASGDLCRWLGVVCSLRHKQRVLKLNLSSAGLFGTIAPSIGNLTYLAHVDLSSNALHGGFPATIGRLHRLRYLDLSHNSLQGEIPDSLMNCTKFTSIALYSNRLTGEIPAWLGGLSNLEYIYLEANNFTGAIPPSLANLSSLQELYFSRNHLEDTIPEGIGRLGMLQYVALGENHLVGTIPATFFNLSSLAQLGVTNNELEGTLPSNLGNNLPNLQALYLDLNHFTGRVPASLANVTTVDVLDISLNNFTGKLPPEIGKLCPDILSLSRNQLEISTVQDWEFITFLSNCTYLRVLDLGYNHFTGELPSSFANLSAHLQLLSVEANDIYGKIPVHIGNLLGLLEVSFSNNRFAGVLPDSIGRLKMLTVLDLQNNLLSGIIPSSLGNLTQMQQLFVNGNNFEGPIPRSLGNLQQLITANFSSNQFTSSLPREIFSIPSLSNALDLSNNHLVGILPSEVGILKKATFLYLSRNNLSGVLPDALSNCQSLVGLHLDSNSFSGSIPMPMSNVHGLVILNLSRNKLSGMIPQELGRMKGLEKLHLAHNYLSGKIPESFENMTKLYQLDLSFNHLEGKVPVHGVFANISEFSFAGNNGLCGGILQLHLPSCPAEPSKHSQRKHHVILKAAIPVASIILFTILTFLSFFLRKKLRGRSIEKTKTAPPLMNEMYPRVSYDELVQGTDGFARNNLIGIGRYGSVYKGNLLLKNTITEVAIKVFDLQQPHSSRSFLAECEVLSKVRHRNLVSVITCCASLDSKRNDFKALVLEFMPNGSLDTWLHPSLLVQERQCLKLMQRLNIVVDIADALDYLHNNCEPPIVHCDLKPSNILLDENLGAHIGDFGLAKILSNPVGEKPIRSKSTIAIRGTIGYVAPEYGEGGQVSVRGDVYSFGIVLLEMSTGKSPTHDMFRDGLTLQNYVEAAFPDGLMKVFDPLLLATEEVPANDLCGGSSSLRDPSNVLTFVTRVALLCCNQAPAERMLMRDAAAELHRIRARPITTPIDQFVLE